MSRILAFEETAGGKIVLVSPTAPLPTQNLLLGVDGLTPASLDNPIPTSATLTGNVTLDPQNLNLEATQLLNKAELIAINAKAPALGQALAAASVPVVLTAAQMTTLTPPTTVTANLGTIAGVATSAKQDTAAGKLDTMIASLGSLDTKLIASAATEAKQTTGNASLASIDDKLVATAQRTPAFSNVTTGGTVAAGKRKILFIFSSDYSGNVGGIPFLGNVDQQIEIPIPQGDTCDAVVYTVSTGSIRIITF